jgi:hypothetical protein
MNAMKQQRLAAGGTVVVRTVRTRLGGTREDALSTTDRLIEHLGAVGWTSTEVTNDDYRLEIHPVHDKQEAGFTLWRRLTDGRLDLIVSGHTDQGLLVNAENYPLELPEETADTLDALLGD